MVKNRGIELSIISQFDIRRLPEFQGSAAGSVEANATNRYVPIYPGSQIWFEYTIEPPHPPQAAYFFKLFMDDKCVTAWDCGAKHNYHGKLMFTLEKVDVEPSHLGVPTQRKGFRFCNEQDTQTIDEDLENGCMEIRVYRIEHRRRLRGTLPDRGQYPVLRNYSRLELMSSGLLEPEQPQRCYKYQLLDPLDEPYAVFRFFHRTYDYMWQNNIIAPFAVSSRSQSSSLMICHDSSSASLEKNSFVENLMAKGEDEIGPYHQNLLHPDQHNRNSIISNHSQTMPDKVSDQFNLDMYLSLSNSDESLKIIAHDSIEDIPSTVHRSSNSPGSKRRSQPEQGAQSSTKNKMSPRQKFKRALKLDLKSSGFRSHKEKRPLSPFTNGGLLRRFMSPEPHRPLPIVTSPTEALLVDETPHLMNIAGSVSNRNESQTSYSSMEGNGKSIMGYLSRKVSRKNTTDGAAGYTAKVFSIES